MSAAWYAHGSGFEYSASGEGLNGGGPPVKLMSMTEDVQLLQSEVAQLQRRQQHQALLLLAFAIVAMATYVYTRQGSRIVVAAPVAQATVVGHALGLGDNNPSTLASMNIRCLLAQWRENCIVKDYP